MDHKKNKANFDKNLVSTNETNSISLYGLTPVVEDAILSAIHEKNRTSLKKLIEPLHPADAQVDEFSNSAGWRRGATVCHRRYRTL